MGLENINSNQDKQDNSVSKPLDNNQENRPKTPEEKAKILQEVIDKQKAAEQYHEDMKENLKELIFEGRLSQIVDLYGKKWFLHILSLEEMQIAYRNADYYDEQSYNLAVRLNILSRALDSVDNALFLSHEDCYNFLKQLPANMILKLYDAYYQLSEEQNKDNLEIDEIKNSLATTLAA